MPHTPMEVLTLALKIVIPLGTIALKTWIDIKIKFATTENQAKIEIKRILYKIALSIAYVIFVLVIVLDSLALFHLYMMWWIGWLIDHIASNGRDLLRLHESVGELINIMKTHIPASAN